MKLTATFGLLLFTQVVLGQTTVQRLDSLFNYLHNNQLFNGNVLVAEKGKIVYQKSFGYADYATKTPNTKDSRFCVSAGFSPVRHANNLNSL